MAQFGSKSSLIEIEQKFGTICIPKESTLKVLNFVGKKSRDFSKLSLRTIKSKTWNNLEF